MGHPRSSLWSFMKPLTSSPATHAFKYIPVDTELIKSRAVLSIFIAMTLHRVGTSSKLRKYLSNGTKRTNGTAFGHQLHQSSTMAAFHLSLSVCKNIAIN